MKLNVKIALEIIESYRTRAERNSYCYDVYSKSYEEIKEEFGKLLEAGTKEIDVNLV